MKGIYSGQGILHFSYVIICTHAFETRNYMLLFSIFISACRIYHLLSLCQAGISIIQENIATSVIGSEEVIQSRPEGKNK
jgi:hypothetical protein